MTGNDNGEYVTLEKTYSEIKEDYMAGYTVVIFVERVDDGTETYFNQVIGFIEYSGTESDPAIYDVLAAPNVKFRANDPNGYPVQRG